MSTEKQPNGGGSILATAGLIVIFALIMAALLLFNATKAEASDVGVKDTVVALADASSTDNVATTMPKDNGGKCHVVVPSDTDLNTLQNIKYWLIKSGCKVESWWSTVELPAFLGGEEEVAAN